MSDPTHVWIHAVDRVRPDGERITKGQAFTPTEHERKVWPRRIEPLDGDAFGDIGEETETESGSMSVTVRDERGEIVEHDGERA